MPVIVCGHTHMQFDRTIGKIRVVNAGSVGMPFGEPGAYWLLLGPNIQFQHTPTISRRLLSAFEPRTIHGLKILPRVTSCNLHQSEKCLKHLARSN